MADLSVAFIGPLPPTRSGVADYDGELLPYLSKRISVTAYEPERAERALGAGHDVLLFQIGNDPLHAPSVEALVSPSRRTPAADVLHDFVLHHLFAAAYLDRGRENDYERELVRAHGERGRRLAQRIRAGSKVPVWDLDPWSWPMSSGVVRAADAVIAHSRLVRGAVLRESPGTWAVQIPHHVAPAARTETAEARRALGLPLERPVAVSLGVVTPAKRVGKILEALGHLPADQRPFLFVGGAVGDDDPLKGKVLSLGLTKDVAFGGYLSEEDFWRAASAATLAVNLRHPTMGETSGAVCRLAGFGLPLLVSDTGWFRELPDTFASKIPIGGEETRRLAEELARIAFDPAERRARSEAAMEWGRERHPDRVAEAYVPVLKDLAEGRAKPLGVSGRVAAGLFDLGIGRPGRHGAKDRGPDARVVATAAARAAGVLPAPSLFTL
jgi:glycosyltransferase involved in cell wall biosynthesis